jgi:hypothetical protein
MLGANYRDINIYIIKTIFFAIIFTSCQNNTSTKNNLSTDDSSLTNHSDTKAKQPDSITNSFDSRIVLRCIDNCDKGKNTISKKNGELPFKIKKTIINDSTLISFNFVSDCCQDFIKEIKIAKDTLFLDYKSNGDVICECYCEYCYQFAISECKWATIYLKKKKI